MSEFFAMGGYAFYIWMAYGMAAFLCVVELFAVRNRVKKARQIARFKSESERNQSARLTEAK
jgi:heme exporter protein D